MECVQLCTMYTVQLICTIFFFYYLPNVHITECTFTLNYSKGLTKTISQMNNARTNEFIEFNFDNITYA